jgi:hypothetical protein
MGISHSQPVTSVTLKAGLTAIAVMLLTMVHHAYGAAIYQTPWRHHIAMVAIPVILILAGSLAVLRQTQTGMAARIAFWLMIVVTCFIPIIWIGLYEGGYNHVIKDLLYFAGVSSAVLTTLFPPPLYEMPNDLLFEVTGILQCPLALLTAYYVFHMLRLPQPLKMSIGRAL